MKLADFRSDAEIEPDETDPALAYLLPIEPKWEATILCFDPSLAKTGYGIMSVAPGQSIKAHEAGLLKSDLSQKSILDKRQCDLFIFREAQKLLYHAEHDFARSTRLVVAMETPAIPGRGMNDISPIQAAEAIWLAMDVVDKSIPLFLIQTNAVKHRLIGAGGGKAPKALVKASVLERVPGFADIKPCNQDTCDAIGAGLVACEKDLP